MRTAVWGALLLALWSCSCGLLAEPQAPLDLAPTLAPGASIKVDGTAYVVDRPRRGELVAFYARTQRSQLWVFRVVALPGEVVTLVEGLLTVDGAAALSPAGLPLRPAAPNQLGAPNRPRYPYVVPAGRYFVVGDNPEVSAESRFWGTLPLGDIAGRVQPE